jgi:ribonuclease-3
MTKDKRREHFRGHVAAAGGGDRTPLRGFAERLDRALTHASARSKGGRDYERLEFLGDRVLGLCVAEMLFEQFQTADEGELSVRLNQLVNADTLADVADELSLNDFIRTGSDVRQLRDSHQKNLRADVVESLIATIYLEGGLDAVRPFIRRYWTERAATATPPAATPRPNCRNGRIRNTWRDAGPTRSVARRDRTTIRCFTVSVTVGTMKPEKAEGRSKRIAEQAAAVRMLVREKVREND